MEGSRGGGKGKEGGKIIGEQSAIFALRFMAGRERRGKKGDFFRAN